MAEKTKIIMDVDTGSDDAVALTLAMLSEDIDLLGITTVNGNLEVRLTTENTLRMVELLGKQDTVKVYRGAEYPLVSTLIPTTQQAQLPLPRWEHTCPEGLHHATHIPTPSFTLHEEKMSAALWLVKTLRKAKDGEITLVPVGPLTNIAVALRSDPRIIPKIKEIVIMGGGTFGNMTPVAEFNVWADPEAMEIVLSSGCPIRVVSLNSTHAGYITTEDAERIREIGTVPAQFVADLILKYGTAAYLKANGESVAKIPIHDALAVCAVVHPEVLETIDCSVHCDISRGFAYGETLIDRRMVGRYPDNAKFGIGANRELFVNWIMEVLEKDKENRT